MSIKNKLPDNQIVFYQTADGSMNIEVLYAEENIWLPQKRIAELFGTTPQNITQHLKSIYFEGEVDENSTCKDFLQVQKEGTREVERKMAFYSLEAIIAVGYRINSERGTEFRQWASGILKNYIHKGYALDSDRMKYGSRFSARYFEEVQEEIRDIRSSERRLYLKITDIYATAFDYSSKAEETKKFFATVQNKLHYAISGKTAAEIIVERVSSKNKNLGLTSWRQAPNGKIMPSDVAIAKNYLNHKEIKSLNRFVAMYLDYAEHQAEKGIPVTMKDWATKLDVFLKFNEEEVLLNPGKVTAEIAKAFAESEFEKYRPIQDRLYQSDFDKEFKKYLK